MFLSAIDLGTEGVSASLDLQQLVVWAIAAGAGKVKGDTTRRRSKYDSSGKLAAGEPYFVLRAQDMLAPELIEAWAVEAELNGCPRGKVAEARAIAAAMRKWHKRKMPD
ncbi:MAG: hypothetical protein IT539_12795 [Bradyrhizobiaceae bacterium]|nr:hypothetical protein [Bradyrhizobiaceae bacterium]